VEIPTTHEITAYRLDGGDQGVLEQLVPLIQRELHRLARGYLAKERLDHIQGARALIHETYHSDAN
jgi:hypothetical protein